MTIQLYTPKNYNELNRKQLYFILKLFEKKLSTTEFLVLAWLQLTNTKLLSQQFFKQRKAYYLFKHNKKRFLLTSDELLQCTKQLEWLLKESSLTKNPIPFFRIRGKKYFGPTDKLYNITLGEFIFAETNFLSFCQSKEKMYLNHLIAILYRKQKKPYRPKQIQYNGDPREEFNDFLFRRNAKKINPLDQIKKLMIFNFYAGARIALQREYPKVFTPYGSSSNNTHNLSKNILSLVSAINQGDPTKNKQLLKINIREILSEIEKK